MRTFSKLEGMNWLSSLRKELSYDLGQKGDVLRVQEVKIAQGIVCKGSGSGQRHTTQQWQRRGLHVANDADERNGIQL